MILFELPCPPNTPIVPVKYRFLDPTKLKIGDGEYKPENIYVANYVTYCFGVGDTIEVLQLEIQYLIVPIKRLKKIPLSNGTFIIDPPKTIRLERVIE